MSLKAIDARSLKQRLDEGSVVLVDVREPGEHAQEHIEGARLVPLSRFALEDFDGERDRAAVFYCRSGGRTRFNADLLLSKGFREAFELTGGIMGWKAAGLPTQSGKGANGAARPRRFGWPF